MQLTTTVLLVVGLHIVNARWSNRFENEALAERKWITSAPPSFDDAWHSSDPAPDYDSMELDNIIPQLPDHEIIRHRNSWHTSSSRRLSAGFSMNGLSEADVTRNLRHELLKSGDPPSDTNPLRPANEETLQLPDGVRGQHALPNEDMERDTMHNVIRNTQMESSAKLSNQEANLQLTSPAPNVVAGAQAQARTDALFGHFHGPHFGMIDHAALPARPAVKGSHSIEGTFLWAIGLFGTVENGAIVLTSLFSKRFKKPLHILVGTLASTDLFISLIYIPSYTYFLLEGDTNFAQAKLRQEFDDKDVTNSQFSFCNISRSIFVEIASVTLTIKAFIALYLYIFTRSKQLAKRIFNRKNTIFFITLAWGVNFVMLFLPSFMGQGKVDFYPNEFVCLSGNKPDETLAADDTDVFLYSFPALIVHFVELSIICACFVKVHGAIMKGKIYSDTNREGDKVTRLNYTRAAKITGLVFASFVVCWLPIYIINMIDPEHKKFPDEIHHLVMDLLLLKSAINPTIYIYGIRSLRHEIRLLCMCRCRMDEKTALERADQSSTYLESNCTNSAETV